MKRNSRKDAFDPFDLDSKTVAEELDERARKAERGDWYPAHGGTEQPFRTRSGRRLQYVWQPSTGRHAYYDVDSDLILSDEEARAYLPNAEPQPFDPNADADFDPKSVVAGDRLITPAGEEITVTRVLSERGATWIFFYSPGHSKFQAALGIKPAEDAKEFRRASDREGWQHVPNAETHPRLVVLNLKSAQIADRLMRLGRVAMGYPLASGEWSIPRGPFVPGEEIRLVLSSASGSKTYFETDAKIIVENAVYYAVFEPQRFRENARGFHVFEMSGNKPLRQVNVKPLTLTKAKQLARIGATEGKHARAVTTDPRGDDFRIVARYEVGA